MKWKWPLFAMLLALLISTGDALSQSKVFNGVVRDANTHVKIRGVNIFVKGTSLGTTSDYKGYFEIRVPSVSSSAVLVFKHIGYDERKVPLSTLDDVSEVYLQPRVIQLQGVEVAEEGVQNLEIRKDLPQTVSVLKSQTFEIQGYVDAGDLLRIDNSVQLDEELSGKKTVAIRGGNADEVVVLYNGVKLNNAYDNVFDLSLIDLETVDRVEVIKGSNTALYGPEAFSGVINVVPKFQQDYTLRFQQRIGSYSSGNWGVHFYRKIGRLNASYSHRRGGLTRTIDVQGAPELKNRSLHHTANLVYNLSANEDGSPRNSIELMWLYTSLDYDNQRDVESVNNFNNVFTAKYSGNLWKLRRLTFSASRHILDEDQFFASSAGRSKRNIDDSSTHLKVEKQIGLRNLDLFLGYSFQQSTLDNFTNQRINLDQSPDGVATADFKRIHHGFVGIAKFRGEMKSLYLQNIDLDFSARHDRVTDSQDNVKFNGSATPANFLLNDNSWRKSMVKFSVNMSGYHEGIYVNSFFNFGANYKFPTLFQQANATAASNLIPEENSSLEFGATVSKEIRDHPTLYGWQLSGNYFLNNYDNKIVEARQLLGGRAQFNQVATARISGFEAKAAVFMFRKKVTLDFGWSRYFISDQEAFPFKSNFKRTLSATINHMGYAFNILWFSEGEQIGLVLRQPDATVSGLGEAVSTRLPSYRNLDIHFSKSFEIMRFKVFGNVSIRNLLNDDDTQLQGLSIRDRRFYLTFGANL